MCVLPEASCGQRCLLRSHKGEPTLPPSMPLASTPIVYLCFEHKIIEIPEGAKHWHGAAPDSWFSHLAFEIPGENASNEWLEPVAVEEYEKLK